jgi:hypothetical protein
VAARPAAGGVLERAGAGPTRAVVCRKEGSYILYNYSGGFSWYLFGPENRLQYDIAGTLGNGTWGYIVGTYDKDAGPNNQRLYLSGGRVAQMSDTLPIALNSAALASDGMSVVSPIPSTAISTSSASRSCRTSAS